MSALVPAEKKAARPSVDATPAEAAPNFRYGLQWESFVGKHLMGFFGGHYELSPGSRGAADCVNYAPAVTICTQVKASRLGSKAHPGASSAEKAALRVKAKGLANTRKKPAAAMLALIKGKTVRFQLLELFRPDPNN